jgi:hypothetical protein
VRRTRYFACNEFSRLVLDTLRKADGKPLSGDEIINQVLAAKGFEAADAVMRAALRKQAVTMLRAHRKRGMIEQTGLGRGVRWKMSGASLVTEKSLRQALQRHRGAPFGRRQE